MRSRLTTFVALLGLALLSGTSAHAADNGMSGGEGPVTSGGGSQRNSVVIIITRGTSNAFPQSQLPESQLPQSQLMTTQPSAGNSITAVER
jgi:hypothetical protein